MVSTVISFNVCSIMVMFYAIFRYNDGFNQRKDITENNKVWDMVFRPNLPLFQVKHSNRKNIVWPIQ